MEGYKLTVADQIWSHTPLQFLSPDCIGMTRGANINREAMVRMFAYLIILETPHPPCITCIMETTD